MNKINSLFLHFKRSTGVFTDTRKVKPGGIFFALKGARFDGNQFAEQALAQGAMLAVVDDPAIARDDRYFLVDHVLTTLQDLARHYRKQFTVPFIGITGSNGKTTTKELVSTVLSKKYKLFATQGNLNNHIGVPLTILSMPADIEIAVVEMGANHQKEIAFLCTICRPTHGVITNIGKAHLEGFGGIEGVKKGKSELFHALRENDGIAFINKDEAFLDNLSVHVAKRIFYGAPSEEHRVDIPVQMAAAAPFVSAAFFDEQGKKIESHSKLVGKYNFNNISTAIALGLFFEVKSWLIKEAIESYLPQNNRSQLMEWENNRLILDAYNANPTSVKGALENLSLMSHPHKVVILGDMLELGPSAESEHKHILDMLDGMDLKIIILVGPLFRQVADTKKHLCFDQVNELASWWADHPISNALMLVKGSRGIKLEQLLLKKSA